jgi:hypothetical protein
MGRNILVGKSVSKDHWKVKRQFDILEIRLISIDWIDLIYDPEQSRALVDTVMNHQVP